MAVDGDNRKAQQDEARDDSVTEGAKSAGGRLNDNDTHHDDESENAGGGDEKQPLQRRKPNAERLRIPGRWENEVPLDIVS